MEHSKRVQTSHMKNIILVLGAVVSLLMTRYLLTPVVVAAIFAIILAPCYRWFQKRGLSNWVCAFLCSVLLAVGFLLPMGGLIYGGIYTGAKQVKSFQEHLKSENVDSFQDLYEGKYGKYISEIKSTFPFTDDEIQSLVTNGLSSAGKLLASGSQHFFGQIPELIISLLVVIFSMFYFLIDGRKIVDWIRVHTVFSNDNTDHLVEMTEKACQSAVSSSALTASIQAGMMAVACLLCGVPNLLLIVTATFFFSFVPIVGTAPISIAIIFYLLVTSSYLMVLVFALIALGIGLSDNFIRPYFIQQGAQIHPLAAFVFTFGAIGTIGFFGIFIGPVTAGLFLTTLKTVSSPKRAPRKE